MKKFLIVGLLFFALPLWAADNCSNLPAPAVLANNGLEQTPCVGASTWYPQYTSPTEAYIKQQSDLLVSTGLVAAWSAAGATCITVEISDGWQAATRDGSGNLQANATNFPDGYAATVAYIHSKGLSATGYSSPNTTTCGGFIGSGGNESQDATWFAAEGIDRLEYDGCNANTFYPSCYSTSGAQIWQYMAQFIRGTGRPMQMMIGFAPSNWTTPIIWGSSVGWNEARISLAGGISGGDLNGTWSNFDAEFDKAAVLSSYVKPGFFGHCDYLIGASLAVHFGGGFTQAQSQTQFGMCSLWSSPLILGMDLSTISTALLNIYKTSAVIAVDQDSAGKMATRYSQTSCGTTTCEVWVKPLHDGTWAMGLLNRDSASHTVSINFAQFGVDPDVKDLWTGTDGGSMTSYSATVAGYGLDMIKATPPASGALLTNAVVTNAVIQ